jgi:hypothetical protein
MIYIYVNTSRLKNVLKIVQILISQVFSREARKVLVLQALPPLPRAGVRKAEGLPLLAVQGHQGGERRGAARGQVLWRLPPKGHGREAAHQADLCERTHTAGSYANGPLELEQQFLVKSLLTGDGIQQNS